MPLSSAQQNFIDLSINHLLDFSIQKEDLLAEIELLRDAILPAFRKNIPHHKFTPLLACLFHPETHLHRLETLNNQPVTIAEVQGYILKLIAKNIYLAGKQAGLDPNALLSVYHLKQVIPIQNFSTYFISTPAINNTPENPYQLPISREQIFSAKIRFTVTSHQNEDGTREERKLAHLDVMIDYTAPGFMNNPISLPLAELPDIAHNHAEEMFLEDLKEMGQELAEDLAAARVIRILKTRITLYRTEIESALAKAAPVLVNKFYFQLLLNNELNFSAVANLTEIEVENLLDPNVINLLRNNLCDYNCASQLCERARLMVAIYFELIKTNPHLLTTISLLSHERIKFLANPPIVHLIMAKKLSFQQACSLPLHLLDLLTNEFYHNFILRHDIHWKRLALLSKQHCEILLSNPFISLICEEKVNLNTFFEIPTDVLTKLADHSYIAEWLKQDIVSSAFLVKLPCLYICAYASRLHALTIDKPFYIYDEKDSVETITNELYFMPDDCNTPVIELLQEVQWDLLLTLKQKLQKIKNAEVHRKSGAQQISLINLLLDVLEQIQSGLGEKPDCQAILTSLICTADNVCQELNKQLYLHPATHSATQNLFFVPAHENNELQNFCTGMLKIASFAKTVEMFKSNRLSLAN